MQAAWLLKTAGQPLTPGKKVIFTRGQRLTSSKNDLNTEGQRLILP
jgi:hypothetical protein